MDRNTVLGAALIFAILIGFSYFNKPSEKQIEAAKRTRDSIEQVQAVNQKEIKKAAKLDSIQALAAPLLKGDSMNSSVENVRKEKFGVFASASVGKEKFYVIENNLIKVTFSNKGGRIYSVELKNYKTFEQKPLILFEGNTSKFGLNFFAQNRSIETESFYFTPSDSIADVVLNGPEVKKGREGIEKF
ncbi:MAG TPA: YidC/Oxa1 family insertase periplasmic-domain containing protein, partial [Prolixibacteraceae bacterium]